jgi:hypothetical protein
VKGTGFILFICIHRNCREHDYNCKIAISLIDREGLSGVDQPWLRASVVRSPA